MLEMDRCSSLALGIIRIEPKLTPFLPFHLWMVMTFSLSFANNLNSIFECTNGQLWQEECDQSSFQERRSSAIHSHWLVAMRGHQLLLLYLLKGNVFPPLCDWWLIFLYKTDSAMPLLAGNPFIRCVMDVKAWNQKHHRGWKVLSVWHIL